MDVTVEKLPKATLKINIVIPSSDVKKAYDEVIDNYVKSSEFPGFRKGQAPKSLVEEKIDKGKLRGEAVNLLLQKHYPQALKEKLITPISNPKVEIKEFDLDKSFEFNATVAVKPEVTLKDYKKELKKLYRGRVEEHKKLKNEAKGDENIPDHIHLHPNEVINTLVENAELEISDLLINEETDRMLARLIDQAQTLGMTIEQYLSAQNKNSEQIRAEYSKMAGKTLKSEFVLQKIVEDEKIDVDDKEIEETINAAGDEKVKESMQNPRQKWYIKSIIAKNKALNKLIEEAEKENGK